jgi:hypothetical protein
MSLINEALKKAQKQRTGDAPSLTSMPGVGGESAERIARRGRSSGGPNLLLWGGVGVAALAVVVAGAFLFLRRPAPAPTIPPATTVSAPVPAPKPAESAPKSVEPAPQPVAPAPVTHTAAVTLPPAPSTPPPQPASVVAAPVNPPLATTVILTPVEPPKPVEVAPGQLAPEPAKPTAPATPAAARKLEPRAINFINSIRVAGIRAASTDSKVLMMDRVYRVGDIVEAEMGLKLAGITASSLTFEDENGARFTRNF